MEEYNDGRREENNLCEICGKNGSCKLGASGIAPVSYRRCAECISRHAENINLVMMRLAADGFDGNEFDYCKSLISFDDGRYIDWDEIKALFVENRDDIIASFKADFG
jgi:hypothetical protein